MRGGTLEVQAWQLRMGQDVGHGGLEDVGCIRCCLQGFVIISDVIIVSDEDACKSIEPRVLKGCQASSSLGLEF